MGFALALTAGVSLMKAHETKKAGKIKAEEAEVEAGQIELAGLQRETDRTERLAEALASQTASAGARGIAAFEGSPLAVLEADIAAAETAQSRDDFQTEFAAMTTRKRGQVAASSARHGAFIGLVGDFAEIAKEA